MRSKWVAAILAIFLGNFGIHKFYLNRPMQGLFYLLFSWTYLPGFISLFEGLLYFLMDEDYFQFKYNN